MFALIVNFWKLSLNDLSSSQAFGVFILGLNGAVTVACVAAISECLQVVSVGFIFYILTFDYPSILDTS
jgi:hypothetical protein